MLGRLCPSGFVPFIEGNEMPIPGSIFAAMLTPMKGDGSVAPEAVAPLVDFVLAQGVHGMYASGSTGESVLQNVQERGEILTALAEHAKGKCSLIAHVGAASTGDAVALAGLAGAAGFDAVSAVPPYYYKHRFEDIAAYYDEIANAAGLPLIIYNIPALTGTDLSTARLLELMQDSRIAGVKYTAQDLFQFGELRKAAPDKKFYFGTDEMFLGASAMGADGGIGSTYNLIGDIYLAVERAISAGNIDKARACQSAANDFIAILLEVGVIPGLKYCLTRLGVPVGPSRAPFASISEDGSAKLDAWMKQSGIEEYGLLSRAVCS